MIDGNCSFACNITTALALRVIENSNKLHPVLSAHKAHFASWEKSHPRDEFAPRSKDTYRRIPEGEPSLWDCVSEGILPRVYRLLDPLYQAIESLGGSVNTDLPVQLRGETVCFTITEGKTQTPHVLTKEEQRTWERYEKDKKQSRWAYEPRFRKYDYIPSGKLTFTVHKGSYFRDSSLAGIESRIGEILLSLYVESEAVRIEREAREAAKRKAEEEARQKELYKQRYNDEIDRLDALENEAADYQRACRIRALVAAVESNPILAERKQEWVAWAKAKADWFDPTIASDDFVFGVRAHSKPEESKKPHTPRWW